MTTTATKAGTTIQVTPYSTSRPKKNKFVDHRLLGLAWCGELVGIMHSSGSDFPQIVKGAQLGNT